MGIQYYRVFFIFATLFCGVFKSGFQPAPTHPVDCAMHPKGEGLMGVVLQNVDYEINVEILEEPFRQGFGSCYNELWRMK